MKETIKDLKIDDQIIDLKMCALHEKIIFAKVVKIEGDRNRIICEGVDPEYAVHYPHAFYAEDRGKFWCRKKRSEALEILSPK